MWVYFWAVCSVALVYVSGFVPVPCCFGYCIFVIWSEVREHDAYSSVLFSQDYFGNLTSFVVPCTF